MKRSGVLWLAFEKLAVIARTIPISETIPVRFDLSLDKNMDVELKRKSASRSLGCLNA